MANIIDMKPVRRTTTASADGRSRTEISDPGILSATLDDTRLYATKNLMVSAPTPTGSIQSLTLLQVKALQIQIGFALTKNTYSAVDPYNNVGKYLFSTSALVDAGYIKADYYDKFGQQGLTAAIHNSSAWTKKDSINSLTNFLAARDLQESVMFRQIQSNYNLLQNYGAIKSSDSPAVIMGMLFVAHVADARQAKIWRDTGIGQLDDNTPLGNYYCLGQYAGEVLSAPTGIR